jgi:hypothetical protein
MRGAGVGRQRSTFTAQPWAAAHISGGLMNLSLRARWGAVLATLLLGSFLAGCGEEHPSDPIAPDADSPSATASVPGTPRAAGHPVRRQTRTATSGPKERSLQGSASKIVGDSLTGHRSR